MIDVPSNTPKLVEYNTIASSFGVLSQKVKGIQKYIRDKYSDKISYAYDELNPLSYENEVPAIL